MKGIEEVCGRSVTLQSRRNGGQLQPSNTCSEAFDLDRAAATSASWLSALKPSKSSLVIYSVPEACHRHSPVSTQDRKLLLLSALGHLLLSHSRVAISVLNDGTFPYSWVTAPRADCKLSCSCFLQRRLVHTKHKQGSALPLLQLRPLLAPASILPSCAASLLQSPWLCVHLLSAHQHHPCQHCCCLPSIQDFWMMIDAVHGDQESQVVSSNLCLIPAGDGCCPIPKKMGLGLAQLFCWTASLPLGSVVSQLPCVTIQVRLCIVLCLHVDSIHGLYQQLLHKCLLHE